MATGSKNVFDTLHPIRWMSELERLEQKERQLNAIYKYMPQIREASQLGWKRYTFAITIKKLCSASNDTI